MSCKYDIESDQLKCSFCTQWFKCTLHYANVQRYALKACQKCISNFNYTILHPQTYKIYKVMLLDTSIIIPPSETHQTSTSHPLIFELHQADQEIKTKITSFYEKRMCQLQQEMQKGTSKVEQIIRNMEKSMIQQSKLQFSQKFPRQKLALLRKIQELKELPLDHWFQKQVVLRKEASGLISSRIKSSNKQNKQNIASIINGTGHRIKNKIRGDTVMQSKDKKSLMQSRQSHQEESLRPKSLNRSIVFKSVKCLDQSQDWIASTFNFQESQRAQVTRLLLAQRQKQSYLPYPISKDNTLMVKNESKRTQADCILDLKGRTSKGGEIIELIGAEASKINFQCFLESLGSQSSAKTVRIIKAGITDYHFDALLRFLSRHSGVETLIVTNNRLSEVSVHALRAFLERNPGSGLKRVYMGNNRIVREHALSSWQGGQRGVQLCL